MTRGAFRELRIDADREYPWELDGELMGATQQLTITIGPDRLLVRVPVRAGASGLPRRRWRIRIRRSPICSVW